MWKLDVSRYVRIGLQMTAATRFVGRDMLFIVESRRRDDPPTVKGKVVGRNPPLVIPPLISARVD
jgi:hypothetical protein